MFKEVPKNAPRTIFAVSVPDLMKRYKFPRIDFAKIDIEGGEGEVFESDADLSWYVSAWSDILRHSWYLHTGWTRQSLS